MKPEFVNLELKDDTNLEWVEEHDYLENSTDNPFDEKNQIDWWKKNNAIRDAFQSIEQEIKGLKQNNIKISKRVISWTKVAKLADCDRNTIRHPKRARWTEQRFTTIIDDIKKFNESLNSDGYKGSIQKASFSLEDKIIKSRNETVNWMNKYYLVQKELETLKRVLKYKENEIFSRDSKIKSLIQQIDDLGG